MPHWMDYARLNAPSPSQGLPQDVADPALFLASDEATFITVAVMKADGGWLTGGSRPPPDLACP